MSNYLGEAFIIASSTAWEQLCPVNDTHVNEDVYC